MHSLYNLHIQKTVVTTNRLEDTTIITGQWGLYGDFIS